jgi:dolichol-phosphate mannosyltransferase
LVEPKLSVIIPTYNERENLPELIAHLRRLPIAVECIVVDDNSPDGTGEVADRLASRDPVIKVVHRAGKAGLASAILAGLSRASAPYVAVMDADLQHPPHLLPRMLRTLEDGHDLVVASRYVRGGGIVGWSAPRRVISRGAILLAHLTIPGSRVVKDPMSGYFAARREILEQIKGSPAKGYKLLLAILARCGYPKVGEVPMTFRPRRKGRSKFNAGEILAYLRLLASLLRRR